LRNKLLGQQDEIVFAPYYEGFRGTINQVAETKFLFKGIYEKIGQDRIRVTELPVGYWTQDFKEHLETLIEPSVDKSGKRTAPILKDYDDMSKDTTVDFTIVFQKDRLNELESSVSENNINGVEKLLKLSSTGSTTNMHLFDEEDKLKKYDKISDIIDDYYDVRLELYNVRKQYMIQALEKELLVLSNKARYIQEMLDDTIDLRKKRKEQVIDMLEQKGYSKIEDDEEYRYLIKMTMDSVTEENVFKMNKERDDKDSELHIVKTTSIQQMWVHELNVLEEEYFKYKEERERSTMDVQQKKEKKIAKKKAL